MKQSVVRLHKSDPTEEETLSHLEVAQIVVNSRRAALDLTVDQVRQLAAIVLVLDDQINTANRRLANMLIADDAPPPRPDSKAKPDVVHVPLLSGDDPAFHKALEALVAAHRKLEADRFTSNELNARERLEKATTAVVKLFNPKPRK